MSGDEETILEKVTKGLVLPTKFKQALATLIEQNDERVQVAIDTAGNIGILRERLFLLATEELDAAFCEIFKKYPSSRANDASINERKEKMLNGYGLVYGEVKFSALCEVFYSTMKLKPGGVFYDLGAGAGRGVFGAHVIHDFEKIYGIELLDGLYKISRDVLGDFKEHKEEEKKKLKKKKGKPTSEPDINFILGDICEYDWSDGDVIFVNSTCFDYQLMDIISKKCDLLKKGAYVLTLTKTLKSEQFECIESKAYNMSWGTGTVHTQLKIADPTAKTVDLSSFKPPSTTSQYSSSLSTDFSSFSTMSSFFTSSASSWVSSSS